MTQLPDEQKKRGVVTASDGNHGLAVAYAAHALGIPATVYLPESATETKRAATRVVGVETEATQFEIVCSHVHDLATVSDESAIRALLEILEAGKLLTEPATSCSVAALVEGRIAIRPGENVVVVLCGANVALEHVRCWAADTRQDG